MLLVLALLAALLAGAAERAGAQEVARTGAPILEVKQVGWDGMVVPGTWSPLRARVTGGSADLNARVEVVLNARYQPGPQATPLEYPVAAYGQDVTLPAGVAKDLTIWVPAEGSMGGTVRLVVGGQPLAEERVEFRTTGNPYWPLVGVLAESPTVARSVSQVELPYQGLPIPLSVVRLAAADLPPTAELMSALSGLVVQGNAAASLTGEQRRVVHEWVTAGGHLVLAGGPDAPRTAGVLPTGVLPASFAGSVEASDLAALARWVGTHETIPSQGPAARIEASGATPLAGSAERPLVWRLEMGQGGVTLLAVDPALEPLASWAGTPALLKKALEPALPVPGEEIGIASFRLVEHNRAMQLMGVVEALPPEAFPTWQTVALVLGGFALLVGPLAYLVLWRVDRRGWVWLLVPAAAVLTSGALYFLGIGRGGRDVLGNVVAHVRLDPEGRQARESLAAGFFAPTHPWLRVTVPGSAPVRALSPQSGLVIGPGRMPIAASAEPPFHVLSGRDTQVEFSTGQWATRTVLLERSLGNEVGGVTARLGIEDGLL
ncbi:MAG TPA: hypothetical protein VHN78_15555, partial [Chloroflexota bacterium]|nr:hypothetical protein [Chloroflexota bacterium]